MDTSIYGKRLRKILNMGYGIKVALFDTRSQHILSNVIPHSTFLNHNYFLFESLKSVTEKVGGISCFTFIFSESVNDLVSHLKNPCYESYYLLFMDEIDDRSIALIAEADRYCVVREVLECNIGSYFIDTNFYAIEPEFRYEMCVDNIASKINSFLKTMEISPSIQFFGNTRVIAKKINSKQEKGRLLLLDRCMDHITPLMYEWRYQPMIYEYFDYKNGVIKMNTRSFTMNDDNFFTAHKNTEIHKLNDFLKASSLALKERSEKLEAHLTIHNFILKNCIGNAQFSDIEYSLLKNSYADIRILKDEKVDFSKRLKLFIVYLHSINFDFTMTKEKMLKDKVLLKYPEFLDNIDCYAEYVKKNSGKRQKHSFTEGDCKLAYSPPILRLVRKFINNKLKFEKIGGSVNDGPILIYVKGGITFSEYLSINSIYKDVIVLTDFVVGYKDIMKMAGLKNEK